MATGRSRAWAGWIAFAGTMLLVISSINIFQGFVALIDDERVVATADKFVLVDMTSWGWTLILSGVVMLAIGIGLLLGMTWARFAGIVVVALHAVSQVAWFGAYPIWAILMITLDTFVLFALTARWSEAREDLRYDGQADSRYGQLPRETAAHRAG
jgi:uncharacterized membrane protein